MAKVSSTFISVSAIFTKRTFHFVGRLESALNVHTASSLSSVASPHLSGLKVTPVVEENQYHINFILVKNIPTSTWRH